MDHIIFSKNYQKNNIENKLGEISKKMSAKAANKVDKTMKKFWKIFRHCCLKVIMVS